MPLDFKILAAHPLSGSVGAEIEGADLSNLSDEQFSEIRAASDQYGVIFFSRPKLVSGTTYRVC